MRRLIKKIDFLSKTPYRSSTEVSTCFREIASTLTNRLPSTEIGRLLRDTSSAELCRFVFNLGKISSHNDTRLDSGILRCIFIELSYAKTLTSQDLNILFDGTVMLSKNFSDCVDSEEMIKLIYKNERLLCCSSITKILQIVSGLTNTTRRFSDLSRLVPALINKFSTLPYTHIDVSLAIHFLALIYSKKSLLKIPHHLTGLINRLIMPVSSTTEVTAASLSNLIYALGSLSETFEPHLMPSHTTMLSLLTTFARLEFTAHHVSSMFFGIAKIAEKHDVSYLLQTNILEIALNKTPSLRPNTAQISYIFCSLGQLALSKKLFFIPDPAILDTLILRFNPPEAKAKDIASFIGGLGELAVTDKLSSKLENIHVSKILTHTSQLPFLAQTAASVIRALGFLAEKNLLDCAPDTELLSDLILQLKNHHPNKIDVFQTIAGLSRIAERYELQLSPSAAESLLEVIESLLSSFHGGDFIKMITFLSTLNISNELFFNKIFNEALKASYISPIAAISLLESALRIKHYNAILSKVFNRIINHLCPMRLLRPLEQTKMQLILTNTAGELHERLIAQLEIQPAAPSSRVLNQPESQNMSPFGAIVSRPAPIIIERSVPEKRPMQISDNIFGSGSEKNSPIGCVIVPNNTSQPRPRKMISQYIQRSLENAIFKAIYDKNFDELQRLLGLTSWSPKSVVTTPHSVIKNSLSTLLNTVKHFTFDESDAEARQKEAANLLVSGFFKDTCPIALHVLIVESNARYFSSLLRACSKHHQYQLIIRNAFHPVIIHLMASQLKPMIEQLISLGIYQDHKAVLKLIDALCVRKSKAPAEEREITLLQQRLLQRALEFHSKHHLRVAGILEEALRSGLEPRSAPLTTDGLVIEAVEFEQLSDTTTANASLTPVVFTTNTVSGQPRLYEGFISESLANPDGSPNMSAYYTAEDINTLLRNYFIDRPGLHVIAAMNFNSTELMATQLSAQLLEYMAHHVSGEAQAFILPICISNHWVGLQIAPTESAVNVTYYDSLDGRFHKEMVMESVLLALTEIYRGKAIHERDPRPEYIQEDSFSCGAYLVENIRLDINDSIRRRDITAENCRKKHLALLEEVAVANQIAPAQKRSKKS